MSINLRRPAFYLTMPQHCNYLPGYWASNLFLDPRARLDGRGYAGLLAKGFRRSGDFVYRPHCEDCAACVAVRVPVAAFRPDRSQRRNRKRNRDLRVTRVAPLYRDEHFDLYRRYQQAVHPGGGMDETDTENYRQFLVCSPVNTFFYEIRCRGRLLAVAVVDQLPGCLSAVYTFYEPAERHRGLGNYAILWQIEQARAQRRQWLYLGYWIRNCRKMAYKIRYRPLEGLMDGAWSTLSAPDTRSP